MVNIFGTSLVAEGIIDHVLHKIDGTSNCKSSSYSFANYNERLAWAVAILYVYTSVSAFSSLVTLLPQ